MAKITEGTPTSRRNKTLQLCRAFKKKVGIPVSRLLTSDLDRERVDALFGLKGFCSHLPLSGMRARSKSLAIFSRCVRSYFQHELAPGWSVLFGTFIDDVGLTTDLEATLRLKRLREKVERIIRKHGFHAIVVMEVQVVTNYSPYGGGQTLLLHAHAIMWRKLPTGAVLQNVVSDMNASPTWKNHFNADIIDLEPIAGGAREIEKIAVYLQKLPYSAKWRKMVGEGKFRFRQHFKGYRHRTALRLMEGLSHYSIRDAVFSVGDGKHIRKQWISKLESWHRDRMSKSLPVADFDIAELWQRIRADNNHGGRYFPFVIE